MVHDFSPFVIKFTENFGIRWYGLFYFLSALFSYLMILWFSRRQHAGFTKNSAVDFIAFCGIGLLIGARIGYLLYEPSLFLQFRNDFPYWGLLAIDDGGLSIHGAMFGLFVSTFLFSLKTGMSQLYLLDLSSVIGAFSIALGRVSSYFSGEYLGRTPSEVNGLGTEFINHWMENFFIKIPQEILRWPQTQFTKLESLTPVVEKIPGLNKEIWISSLQQYQDSESARVTIQNNLEQIIHEVQSGNTSVLEMLNSLLEFRHPVQLYAAVGEGVFVFLFLFLIWYQSRKPGVVTSWFLILYSLMNIFIEQFALPEAQLGYRWLGVTQTQLLSLVFLILGLWLLFFYGRGGALATPGWGLGQHVKIHRRR